MEAQASLRLSILSILALAGAHLGHATTIVEVNFDHLAALVGDPDGLDDGDRIQDVSGNGYHGFWGATNSNIPVVSTPNGSGIDTTGTPNGKVFLRDGLTGIPDAWDGPLTTTSPYFTFDGTQSYTFEAVVNWNNTAQSVNGLMGQASVGSQFWMRESGGFLHYAFGVESGSNANLFSNTIDISAAKTDGQWHGITVIYDGPTGQIRSYLDGSLLHTNTDSDIGSLSTMVNGTSDFFIGAYNATATNYFDGLQDTYRISSGALAAAEFLPVPEPSTALLSWLLLGISLMTRRR